jgi:hypothetical protein
MSDPPGRVTDTSTPVQTSHNPFGSLFERASHAATTAAHAVSEKAHEVANDPNVRRQVQNGTHIAGNIGVGVVNGVKQDGQETAAAARRGDYATVARHVVPMVLGGGIGGVVVKEVAPIVIAQGMNQLPPETRARIENSGAGRVVMVAAQHGRIPTSPADIARVAISGARQSTVETVIGGSSQGEIPAGMRTSPALGAVIRGLTEGQIHTGGFRPAATVNIAIRTAPEGQVGYVAPRSAATVNVAGGSYSESQLGYAAPRGAVTVNVASGSLPERQIGYAAQRPAPPPSAAEKPIVVNTGNQVFPSWMKPAVVPPAKH